jgi:hypothetical protein
MIVDLQHLRSARWPWLAIYCGTLAAFTVDLTCVNTLPFGIFYVPLVGSAFHQRDNRAEWVLATLACAMVFIGSFSPSIDLDTYELAVNRALSIAAILGTATVVHYARPFEKPRDRSPPPSILWERSGDVYHATVINLLGEVRCFLAVEPAGRVWCWIAWRPKSPELKARRGQALTVQQAMRQAERAARKW